MGAAVERVVFAVEVVVGRLVVEAGAEGLAAGDWVRLGLVAGREAAVVEEEREAEASGCRSGARLAEEALLLALADVSGAASVRGAACPASSCGRTPAFSSGGRRSVSPPVSSVWEAVRASYEDWLKNEGVVDEFLAGEPGRGSKE